MNDTSIKWKYRPTAIPHAVYETTQAKRRVNGTWVLTARVSDGGRTPDDLGVETVITEPIPGRGDDVPVFVDDHWEWKTMYQPSIMSPSQQRKLMSWLGWSGIYEKTVDWISVNELKISAGRDYESVDLRLEEMGGIFPLEYVERDVCGEAVKFVRRVPQT